MCLYHTVTGGDTSLTLVRDTTSALLGALPPSIDTIFLSSLSGLPDAVDIGGGYHAAGTSATDIRGYISFGGIAPLGGYDLHAQFVRVGSGPNGVGFWVDDLGLLDPTDTLHFYFTAQNHVGTDTSDVLAFTTGSGLVGRYPSSRLSGGPTGMLEQDVAEFSAYPNPAEAGGVVRISGTGAGPFVIFDLSGMRIKEGLLTEGTIDLGELRPGCYFLRTGIRQTIRVIVQ